MIATTGVTPCSRTFSICLRRLAAPASTSSGPSPNSSGGSGRPATIRYLPECDLQRAHRRDEHGGVGHQARGAALDVEELLGAHVGAEAGLGDDVVAAADARSGRRAIEELPWRCSPNGPAWTKTGVLSIVCRSVGLIASRSITAIEPAAPSCSAVTGCPVARVADDDAPEPGAQVGDATSREAEDRHHLGRGGDVEAGLRGDAVLRGRRGR